LGTANLSEAHRVVAVGEILWDVFGDSTRLGGAPLNFAAHAARLGHDVRMISAVGEDDLGRSARARIESLGLNTQLIQTTPQFPTGIASVRLGTAGETAFEIHRPAAYDAVRLREVEIRWLSQWNPEWLYHGSLFLMTDAGATTLRALSRALPRATRFYDVNLRPKSYNSERLTEFLCDAGVVKLNEDEMAEVARMANLPRSNPLEFCQQGAARYRWRAACVTLGAKGCALWLKGDYVEEPGFPITVADTVGAGDGFSAALVHGLSLNWGAAKIAQFANRVGAIIASRPGGIPDWNVSEVRSAPSASARD